MVSKEILGIDGPYIKLPKHPVGRISNLADTDAKKARYQCSSNPQKSAAVRNVYAIKGNNLT